MSDRQTRSVQGVVRDDEDAPLEWRCRPTERHENSADSLLYYQAERHYHFHSLNPDIDYELKADHQGANSGSKTLSSFDSRKSAVDQP